MCGIAGYNLDGKLSNREDIAAISQLLISLSYEMSTRGSHAWGTLSHKHFIKSSGNIIDSYILPEPLPPSYAIHTRHATHGAASDHANAHPFESADTMGNICGMHNGVIYNHSELNSSHGRTFAVDSQHIFAHLAEGQSLAELEGYGAIVYLHDGVWKFGCFNGGELTLARTRLGWIFASTKASLVRALRFAGLSHDRWYHPRQGKLYRFSKKPGAPPITIGALNISQSTLLTKWDDDKLNIHDWLAKRKDSTRGRGISWDWEWDKEDAAQDTLLAQWDKEFSAEEMTKQDHDFPKLKN